MNEIFADHRFVECNNFLSRWRRRRKNKGNNKWARNSRNYLCERERNV